MDHPAYGDRRVNRRIGEDRRTKKARDRRHTYPGSGRTSRKGHCRECGEETDAVALWEGKPVNLCQRCSRRIREEG
jgi:hypothetical protein